MKYFTLNIGSSHVLKTWGLKGPVYMKKCARLVILFNLLIPKNVQHIAK